MIFLTPANRTFATRRKCDSAVTRKNSNGVAGSPAPRRPDSRGSGPGCDRTKPQAHLSVESGTMLRGLAGATASFKTLNTR